MLSLFLIQTLQSANLFGQYIHTAEINMENGVAVSKKLQHSVNGQLSHTRLERASQMDEYKKNLLA